MSSQEREAHDEEREEGRQNPLIHEGADPDPEQVKGAPADDRVRVESPDGEEVR